MAFAEQFIDLVNRPLAVARRTAPPERRFEAGVPVTSPAASASDQTLRLARQIRKRSLQRLKPADEARAIDQAISGWLWQRDWELAGAAATPSQFIVGVEHMDSRPGRLGVLRRGSTMRFCGSKSWKEAARGGRPFFVFTAPAGLGREGAGFSTRPRAATTMRRRRADFGGPQNTQHGAIGGPRQPRNRICQRQAPAWRKGPQRSQ